MNKITVDLSDEAITDLRDMQLKLREHWQHAPGLEDHEVTEADAVRAALSVCLAGGWDTTDLLPPEPQGHA